MSPISQRRISDLLRGLAIAAAFALFLTYSGAFGSGGAPFPQRLLYWMSLLIGGGFWASVCARLLERVIDLEERPWRLFAVLTLMVAAPYTIVVWAATGYLYFGQPPALRYLPQLFPPVLMISAIMTGLGLFMSRKPVETHASAPDAAPSRFLDRLPPRLRGARLFAVQAEDHYLRLHTDRGSDLILMRLSDALGELEGLEGAQTHRSWWVARDALRDVSRGDGRALLTLEGGLQAPVSRRYARALRQGGWW